jgi:hypothetical protein
VKKISLVLLFAVFLLGVFLRYNYIYPDRIIFGYDQVINAVDARKIVDNHDLIVQQVTPNALGLNHGVLWDYFAAIPYFLGGGNPMTIAYWYAFFNAIAIISVFFFTYYLFRDWSIALTSSFITAISYHMILISGWISNTTVVLYLMPLFFLGFWLYREGRNWGLVLSAFFLGLFVQSQMLMVYNFAAIPILWLVFRLRLPNLKTILLSVFTFSLAVLTMIVVETRSNFSSLRVFLKPSRYLDESSLPFIKRFLLFGKQFLTNFSLNLSPRYLGFGMVIGIIILLVIVRNIFCHKTGKEEKNGLILLLIFLISPIFMLAIGYHDKPWSLMGMIPAISIAAGYAISKISSFSLKIFLLCLFSYLSISMTINSRSKEELFINQEPSSTLRGQLAVVDYTYREAKGEKFAINAVTYPLYENTYWSYHYPWYGIKNYGYLPSWLGGDQLYPYNTLPKSSEKEKIFYMITDETRAIPEIYRAIGKKWGFKYGKLLEEKLIGGFTVQKFERDN